MRVAFGRIKNFSLGISLIIIRLRHLKVWRRPVRAFIVIYKEAARKRCKTTQISKFACTSYFFCIASSLFWYKFADGDPLRHRKKTRPLLALRYLDPVPHALCSFSHASPCLVLRAPCLVLRAPCSCASTLAYLVRHVLR